MQTRERAHCARSVFPFIKKKKKYTKRSAILRFLVSPWGGGDVLNLVFGSSSSSYMDCEVHCVLSVTIGLVRIRF